MWATYEYNCRYADDTTGTSSDGVHAPPRKRRSFFGGYRMMGPDVDDTTDTPGGDVHSSPPRDTRTSLLGGIRMMGRAAASTSPSPATPSQGYREADGASAASTTSSGIFDERKSRYAGASAAMAFPHVLGVNLGSDSPPNMRSFAYNFGTRTEEPSYTHGLLDNFISEYDLRTFSGIFFSAMAPIADYMDPENLRPAMPGLLPQPPQHLDHIYRRGRRRRRSRLLPIPRQIPVRVGTGAVRQSHSR